MRIARNGDRTLEQAVEKMSPFERKNLLLSYAREDEKKSAATLLDAGRGNPNWIAARARESFFLFGRFAMDEARRSMRVPGVDIAGMPKAAGAAVRFQQFLDAHLDDAAAPFLRDCLSYAESQGFDLDEFVQEWTEGITGCEYPVPERILKYTQEIVRRYLLAELCGGKEPSDAVHGATADAAGHTFDLFATEGGTAAMCYLFYCLKSNFLIHEGDTMALMTPIFTPYIEIPELNDYDLEVVNVNASTMRSDGTHGWQYPQEELEKLADPNVRLLCLVNPSNPPSYAMSEESRAVLVKIVREKNPNLMIVTDDVYGTFVPGYRSLFADLPYNTASIYSFSKYFGATGWRLAVAAVAKKNIFDDSIAALSDDEKKTLNSRYSSLGDDIPSIRFIDRMVADSRLVALNGTAGLSTPQQVQMSMFALQELMDRGHLYKTKMLELVRDRFDCLWESLDLKQDPDPLRADYYSIIDLDQWSRKLYGDDFADWLEKNYHSLDFVFRLAKDTGIVVMDGGGFDAPSWSIRVSLANLQIDDYQRIGEYVRQLLAEYADVWKNAE
ncbi:bifunctional aspartate transaminase/aspartate 4-decarboxylase [Bifidobacterium sp. BRDM6]|uniref:Aminotransferase n=2 Tax=Bifidobacterium choloepi TaxID=2614131 RepID=A0A6I5MY40_9BIFI|nr:bifunctional aspartate transaminase/aspartate 4-decarboxylase [Bifidobacterium choloepi]